MTNRARLGKLELNLSSIDLSECVRHAIENCLRAGGNSAGSAGSYLLALSLVKQAPGMVSFTSATNGRGRSNIQLAFKVHREILGKSRSVTSD